MISSGSSHRPPASRAAGGVVWRQVDADVLVALVHRPRYDDWSLPKGKLEPGEHPLLAGVREVREETGSDVIVGRMLSSVRYSLGETEKRVSYWAMQHINGEHQPSREVDEISWLTIAEANRRLTYPIDRGVLADFARIPAETTTVLLVRHARAGKRSQFSGDDRLRPLEKIGRRQARDAVPFLTAFAPANILSADRVRCEQTVQPLSEHLGLRIATAPEFSDEAYAADPDRALKTVRQLAGERTASVICSQGHAILALLGDLEIANAQQTSRKGSVWALSWVQGELVAGTYYSHPG
ncbi:NUDIX hydrolase [Jatrophihabitans sp. DSM 45814]